MRLGILTDIHIAPLGNPADGWHNPHQFETARDRLTRAIAALEAKGVDRLAVLGDLTHFGDAASVRETLQLIATATVPTVVIPGNHDLGTGPTMLQDMLASDAFPGLAVPASTPAPTLGAWQEVGIGLNRAEPKGYLASPVPDVATWPAEPTVLLSHFPIFSLRDVCAAADLKYPGDLRNLDDFATLLRQRSAPTIVVSGHLHVREVFTTDSVLQFSCGAQVESLFEATIIDFTNWDDGRVSIAAFPVDPVWPGVDPALSAPEQSWQWTGSVWQPGA